MPQKKILLIDTKIKPMTQMSGCITCFSQLYSLLVAAVDLKVHVDEKHFFAGQIVLPFFSVFFVLCPVNSVLLKDEAVPATARSSDQ